jgi:hypothetical protein
MRKSDLLRVQDVRDAYRLIGDCRDLGSEPALWQRRMLLGLCQLIGAPMGTCGEGFWIRPAHPVQPLFFLTSGSTRAATSCIWPRSVTSARSATRSSTP